MQNSSKFQPAPLLLFAICFVLILIVFGVIRHYVFGKEFADLLYEALFIIALVTVGFLRNIMPVLGNIINKGIGYYLSFMWTYLATFVPGMLYFLAAKWVSQEGGQIVNVIFFVLSGLLWFGFLMVLFPSPIRTRIFNLLSGFGWLSPFIFVINFVFISLVAFGFLAFWVFGTDVDCAATSDTYLNLFGYHLLESIPGLKINQTLRIDEPFAGERPFELGLMILIFKVAVLIPSIGAFRSYWKARSEQNGDVRSK